MLTKEKICDRCGHNAGRHYSGSSQKRQERGGNFCAAHDCRCRGFIEATLIECGTYLGHSKTRLGSVSYQCVELRLYGYATERALEAAICSASFPSPSRSTPDSYDQHRLAEEHRKIGSPMRDMRKGEAEALNQSDARGVAPRPVHLGRTLEPTKKFDFPWVTVGALLYALIAATWVAKTTPSPAAQVVGYGLANLGYALVAAGLFGFPVFGLRKRWQVFLVAVMFVAEGTALSNTGA
jgi:hypothetical protein